MPKITRQILDESKLHMELALHISEYMARNRLTTKEFAVKCGLTEKCIQRLLNETYQYLPSLSTLSAIANGTDTTLSDLLYGF